MTTENCIICDEKTSQTKMTSCPYCEFQSCRICVRKYVLNEVETKCMNCKKTWTRAHQNTILLPSFVNKELRAHQEQVFYEREMALFPATVEIIEERRITHNLEMEYRIIQDKTSAEHANVYYLKTLIRENSRLIKLHNQTPKMYSDVNMEDLVKRDIQLTADYKMKKEELEQDVNRKRILRSLILMTPENRKIVMAHYINGADPEEILDTLIRTGQMDIASKNVRTQFIRACPVETCRGFLSSKWKCGLCNVFTCSKCHVPKTKKPRVQSETENANEKEDANEFTEEYDDDTTDNHVCNPDDIATAELLAKDTKPCPQCGTGIFKIDGCDQMWCTECRTAFNWRTGQLETGHVHNPHYFEYQRRIGANTRNILDMPCNALAPNQYHGILRHLIYIAMNSASCSPIERVKNRLKPITNVTRIHIRERTLAYAISIDYYAEYVLPRYRPDAIQNNLELRVLYLIEQISKDEFKSSLSREAKQFNKKIEIGQVVQTVIFGMSDILTRLVNFLRETHRPINNNGVNTETDVNFCDPEKIFEMFSEIDALIEYANECLEFICKQYNLTRVAIFVRDTVKKHQCGLYSTRVIKEETPDGIRDVLVPVKAM